jgi:hypothetical protein
MLASGSQSKPQWNVNEAMGSQASQGSADQQALWRLEHTCARPVIPVPPPCKAGEHRHSESRQKPNLDLCIRAAQRSK